MPSYRSAPKIAPIISGKKWADANTKPPAPARKPSSGSPSSTDAKKKRTIPSTIPGSRTASTALPTLPAFRPPTNPAISGPTIGSQNRRMERMNIHAIALPMLPDRSAISQVSHGYKTRRSLDVPVFPFKARAQLARDPPSDRPISAAVRSASESQSRQPYRWRLSQNAAENRSGKDSCRRFEPQLTAPAHRRAVSHARQWPNDSNVFPPT